MEHSPHGARIKPARARNIPNSRKSNPSNIISFPRNERTRLKRVSSKHKRQCVRGVSKLFRALREQRTFCYGSYRTWKRIMKYDHLRRMHCLESLLLSCCCSFLSVFALFFFCDVLLPNLQQKLRARIFSFSPLRHLGVRSGRLL